MGIIDHLISAVLISIIPILYTSAGFAGGSAFLAVLLLSGYSPIEASFYGLIFNVVSASASFIRWRRYLERGLVWYVVGSMPLAYVGGQLRISEVWLRLLITALVITSGTLMLLTMGPSRPKSLSPYVRVMVGMLIGLAAGITGIGGGIYLSPFLVFSRDALPKQTAATTTFFILLNSLSGLFGKIVGMNTPSNFNLVIMLVMPMVVLGALIGSFIGANKLRQSSTRKLMGTILIIIGFSILLAGQ